MELIRRADGKTVGQLGDDGVFRKKVQGSRHLLLKHDAWGMDWDILEELPDGTEIRVKDTDTGKVYISSDTEWLANGIVEIFGEHGKQVFLPRKYFRVVEPLVEKLV